MQLTDNFFIGEKLKEKEKGRKREKVDTPIAAFPVMDEILVQSFFNTISRTVEKPFQSALQKFLVLYHVPTLSRLR